MTATTQLWVYIGDTGEKIKLDLYNTDPIKLTFTAETLNDLPAVSTTYSQTFRVPATSVNDQFFKHWWNPNINDFDVTKKVSAEIVTSSGFFTSGQIRLQKVYKNSNQDLVDYEILFLGEIRDFATQIGEGFLNSLDLSNYNHRPNLSLIEQSWLADAADPLNPGLFGGDLVYPIVEYGYEYDADGVVLESMIKLGGYNAFTDPATPLQIGQLRPWIRVKALVDEIFALTNYTYTSNFFDSVLFRSLYTNATGNTADVDISDVISTNLLEVVAGNQSIITTSTVQGTFTWPNEVIDSGDNWNGTTYTVPVSHLTDYIFSIDFTAISSWTTPTPPPYSPYPNMSFALNVYVNGTPYTIATGTNAVGVPSVSLTIQTSLVFDGSVLPILNQGDEVTFGFVSTHTNGPTPVLEFTTTLNANMLKVIQAPFSLNPATLLSNKVKIIDFFKSIIKKFRLVMVPDRDNPNNFIIETWNDYIGSGIQLDWTHKLDGNKDIQFEPLFFSQTSVINFKDQEDADYANSDNQTVFKEAYGTRIYDSANDLLIGETDIETQFAPTPVERVNNWGSGNFIIPKLGALEALSADAGAANQSTGLIKPIVAKPRLLFYNGIKASGFPGWYLNTTTNRSTYPQMSYLEHFPPQSDSLNLNWEVEPGRWVSPPDGTIGEDVYTRYWKSYIDSIYSPESRKMTANFILDTEDLKVNFNDLIWVHDSWWRILKIQDAQIEGINSVKVELIKVLEVNVGGCQCGEYYITDNRDSPVSSAIFEWIDCATGDTLTDTIYLETKVVCSCSKPTSAVTGIVITDPGLPC